MKFPNQRKWLMSFCHTTICSFFSRLFEIDADCCCLFEWNDKDQLKLFILKFTQWTTKRTSIDQLPIVNCLRWKGKVCCIVSCVLIWTRRYNDIVFKPHINNNYCQQQQHSRFVLPFCLLFSTVFWPTFSNASFFRIGLCAKT